MNTAGSPRNAYNPALIGIHWLTLLLLIAVYLLIELREIYPKGSDPRDVAGRKARTGVVETALRGAQRCEAAGEGVEAGAIVAERTFGVPECDQHGLFISKRCLPLGGLAGTDFGAHAAAVEQPPGNKGQDGRPGAG